MEEKTKDGQDFSLRLCIWIVSVVREVLASVHVASLSQLEILSAAGALIMAQY
jgi:hypothetical protein